MATYIPTEWRDGDTISAERMNHLEAGVAARMEGAPGRDGIDGKDGAPGKDGRDGIDGKDGAPGRDGADGAPGAPGKDGDKGDPGEGVPAGGTAGQVLAKASAADFDTRWVDPPESGKIDRITEAEIDEIMNT